MPDFSEHYPITTTAELNVSEAQQIEQHWQRFSEPGQLARGDHMVHYTQLIPPGSKHALVLVSGRSELYPKFKELSFDLNRMGYAVFIPDHLGQGMSDRPLGHPHKGHVTEFDDYAEDLACFIEQVVHRHEYPAIFMMAHSMGGAIALRMLQTQSVAVDALVLSSPMIGINLAPFPAPVARGLAHGLAWLADRFGHSSYYAPTQGDYKARPFAINRLTHSEIRYQRMLECMEHYPHGQLGGPTVHWLREGIAAGLQIVEDAGHIQVPLLLMQAGDDVVVNNKAQDTFCQKLGIQPRIFNGAYHELWLEQDHIRTPVLAETHEFFQRHLPEKREEMHTYKAVIVDLDGTLLSPEHTVSDITRQTILSLLEQDTRFVIATGRHYMDVRKVIEDLNIESYLITCNGAQVNNKQGEVIFNQTIPSDLLDIILKQPVPDDILLNVYLDDAWLVNKPDDSLMKYNKQSGFTYQVMDPSEMSRDRVNKIFFWGPHESLLPIAEKIRSQFGDELYSAFSLPSCFEIMAKGVNKGSAVEVVLNEKQIALKNAIAFGDGMNDFEMLSCVGQGVIMDNALPELKQRLPDMPITTSNAQDGVAQYLQQHVIRQENSE